MGWILPIFLTASLVLAAALLFFRIRLGSFHQYAQDILHQAEKKGDKWVEERKREWEQELRQKEKEWEEKRQRHKESMRQKENDWEEKERTLQEKERQLLRQEKAFKKERDAFLIDQEKLVEQKLQTDALRERYTQYLADQVPCSVDEVWQKLREEARSEIDEELSRWKKKQQEEIEQQSQQQAQKIVASSIQRICVSTMTELSATTILLPREEMKAWIIGREGRNIRAFERAAGVNLLIEENPGAVTLSSFDPLRKAIAKRALQKLLDEGRIFPARIEEVIEEVEQGIEKEILKKGEDAAVRTGAYPLHPKLYRLLGLLHFRTSLGQNVLDHSIEVAAIMGLFAAELRLDIRLAKRIGLLHDIGKAISHDKEMSHARAGYELARELGETEEVANGIGCHHFEMEPQTVEGSLCHSADAVSAGRPGARSESWGEYIRRVEALEKIATAFPGVDKAYVMQAGREIIILASSDRMNDQRVRTLARDITKKIEQELSFPGKIKVTVIREKRVIHYAV